MTDRVQTYYDGFDEWSRLQTPAGRLEYKRTLSYITARLSRGSDVLDVGGGPGRYTIALAEANHRVSLIDPSTTQIETARSKAAAAAKLDQISVIATGDVRDLSRFESESFDAALALGPFYHLVQDEDRVAAASELARVLRPSGEAFVSIIPRLSGVAALVQRGAADPEQVPPAVLEQAVATGVFVNPTDRGFQDGYYPEIAEVERLFSNVGFEQVDLFSIRGLGYGFEPELHSVKEASPATAEAFERILEATCRQTSVIELGGHVMLTLRKPGSDSV